MELKTYLIYKLPRFVVKWIVKTKRKIKGKPVLHESDKIFPVDFVEYLEKYKPSFKYEYFNKKDRKEIDKMIKNKKKLAYSKVFDEKDYFDEEDLKYQEKYRIFFKSEKIRKGWFKFKSYSLPLEGFSPSVFYHKQGLDLIPNLNQRLKDKDILDCGAFIGDSALIFEETACKKVYSLEPDEKNFKLLEKVIVNNNLKKVYPLKFGVGNKEEIINFSLNGAGSYISEKGSKKIEIKKIDNLSYNIGLIKMDIEGYEYNALVGAEKTIKEKKPILIICLYHTGKDFFEIPPMLKKWVPEYKFRFVNLNHSSAFAERMLIAYIPDKINPIK